MGIGLQAELRTCGHRRSGHAEFGRECFRHGTVVLFRQILQIIGVVDQSEIAEIVLRQTHKVNNSITRFSTNSTCVTYGWADYITVGYGRAF